MLEASAPLACVQKSGLDSRADFGARIKEGREAFACERERERERERVRVEECRPREGCLTTIASTTSPSATMEDDDNEKKMATTMNGKFTRTR